MLTTMRRLAACNTRIPTSKADFKLRVPGPRIEPGTSGVVDQSVTTRLPHHVKPVYQHRQAIR
ncbi:hypothetical protein DPMN_119986, partial [Dreissena polymorpha]